MLYQLTIKENAMENLTEAIEVAKEIMNRSNMPFVTIWAYGKRKKSFGFNFESKPVGYTIEEYGVRRTVLHVFHNMNHHSPAL